MAQPQAGVREKVEGLDSKDGRRHRKRKIKAAMPEAFEFEPREYSDVVMAAMVHTFINDQSVQIGRDPIDSSQMFPSTPVLSLEPVAEAEDVLSDDDGDLCDWDEFEDDEISPPIDFDAKLTAIVDMVARMLPAGDTITIAEIQSIASEAIRSTDDIYGKQQAIDAGGDYRFPPDIVDRDVERLMAAGNSLEEMTRLEHHRMAASRLNFERIAEVVDPSLHSVEDMDRLYNLVEGMVVIVDEDVTSVEYFIPREVPPPQRALYLEVQSAVNFVIAKLHAQDLLFLLPTELVKLIPGCHFTPIHWTTKKGKRVGRILFDAKDAKFGSALNSLNAKAALKEAMGSIHHPSITTIVRMILKFADDKRLELGDQFHWDDLHLFKLDLANAFSLLFFRPEYVKRMICELTDSVCVVYHVGQFGWVGTPYCFQVITRILSVEINRRLRGIGDNVAYVDDIIAVCLTRTLDECKEQAIYVIKTLLGDDAHAVDKDEDGRALECIGWWIDLDKCLLTLSRRNFLKVFYGFYVIDTSSPVSLREMERLCSYSARYTLIAPILKGITNILYSEKKRFGGNKSVLVELSPLGKIAIRMWRAVLVLLRLRETTYARSLDSFRCVSPRYQIEYDASLTGIGVIVRDLTLYVLGDETSGVLKVGSIDLPFDLQQNSKYQNTVEFLGATLGLALLAQLGITSTSVKIVSDSRASIKWGTTGLFTGSLSRRTSFVFMFVSVQYNLDISEGVHVAGIRNVICDKLSRGIRPSELGFSPETVYDFTSDATMLELIKLCDPTPANEILDEEAFMDFWFTARDYVGKL